MFKNSTTSFPSPTPQEKSMQSECQNRLKTSENVDEDNDHLLYDCNIFQVIAKLKAGENIDEDDAA